jgi:hypothetical protein
MANKSLHKFSVPTIANICTGPKINVGENGFMLKPALINMVQAHLQHFLKICSTFTIKEVTKDAILLCLFPFSLLGKAKQWFYANKDKNTTWDICSIAFLAKFSPIGLHSRMSSSWDGELATHTDLLPWVDHYHP